MKKKNNEANKMLAVLKKNKKLIIIKLMNHIMNTLPFIIEYFSKTRNHW